MTFMIKKILLSTAVLGTFTAYAVYKNSEAGRQKTAFELAPAPSLPPITPSPHPNATPTPRGKYKDGSYTGPVADAFYGPLQVKVIITGGKITDVQFLQYPTDRQTSVEINQQAIPFLKQEAITVQSAKVAGVTGATQTSKAFIESLDAALNQAI